jgi:hypothetical protein
MGHEGHEEADGHGHGHAEEHGHGHGHAEEHGQGHAEEHGQEGLGRGQGPARCCSSTRPAGSRGT